MAESGVAREGDVVVVQGLLQEMRLWLLFVVAAIVESVGMFGVSARGEDLVMLGLS